MRSGALLVAGNSAD
jgi:hypothetical protein